MFGLKLNKYNKRITAKYVGTTMSLRNSYFYINCEYINNGNIYTFISEPIAVDPQGYIKDNFIKEFEIDVLETNNGINFKKYKIDIDEILDYVQAEIESC